MGEREVDVGERALECSDEVGYVKAPEERAQSAAFCRSFEDVDIGGGGVVGVEHAHSDGCLVTGFLRLLRVGFVNFTNQQSWKFVVPIASLSRV